MTAIKSRATSDVFEKHDKGTNLWLGIGPSHNPAITDELIVSVRHRYSTSSGVGFSRTQVEELHEWLGRWLEHGWPGVPRQEGPTSADVIEFYKDIAIRERIAADHVRCDAAREVDAALALIPADKRTVDLEQVAKAQSALWARVTGERNALENTRVQFVSALVEMSEATNATADVLRAVARKTLDRYNHPAVRVPDPAPEAPVYQFEQLDLFTQEPEMRAA